MLLQEEQIKKKEMVRPYHIMCEAIKGHITTGLGENKAIAWQPITVQHSREAKRFS